MTEFNSKLKWQTVNIMLSELKEYSVVDIIVQRWEKITGEKAGLVNEQN